jgi:acyl-CoA synthetase (AMP-forming)/AMP-acid ligase II
VLADDFVWLVALEALRAGVPASNDAVRVQHVDGIIRYGLDKETIPSIFSQWNVLLVSFHIAQLPHPKDQSRGSPLCSPSERGFPKYVSIWPIASFRYGAAIKGQKPVAFVIRKAGHTVDAESVKQFALANAPAYQHPRFVWFVDELPLASTNKVDRGALHQMAEERLTKSN